jgi:DNA-binding transcriptional MerR regulator
MAFTVGELARLTGVTVRALHHYDELGLLRPSQRSDAGYRLYDDHDVLRLQQILLFRELGLPLDEIATAITQAASQRDLLRRHRDALVDKRARLDAMLAAVDATLDRLEKGTTMSEEDVQKSFGGFDPAQYEDEARARWGDSAASKESARRTKRYGAAEWQAIRDEAAAIYARIVALLRAGAAPGDAAVQAAVADHRAHITRWFYACTPAIHHGLGEMYVADPRFAANLDAHGAGLAQFLCDAIAASSP